MAAVADNKATFKRVNSMIESAVRDAGGDTMTSVRTSSSAAADIKASLEAQVQSAYDEAMDRGVQQGVEPLAWWDVYAFGPIQPGAQSTPPGGFTGPLLPHDVIRVGEQAFVATIILLNPFGPSVPSATDLLSTFALPYRIEYQTANLTTWSSAGVVVNTGNFVPGQSFYVDVQPLNFNDEGLYEMNITARVLGAGNNPAPPFAGFAREVLSITYDLFSFLPQIQNDKSVRFQVYK